MPLPEKMDRVKAVVEAHKLTEEAADLLTELAPRAPLALCSTVEKVVQAIFTAEAAVVVATSEEEVVGQTLIALAMMLEQVEADLLSQIRFTHQTSRTSRALKVAMDW